LGDRQAREKLFNVAADCTPHLMLSFVNHLLVVGFELDCTGWFEYKLTGIQI